MRKYSGKPTLYCSFLIFTLTLKVAPKCLCFVTCLHVLRRETVALESKRSDVQLSRVGHMTFAARSLRSNELWITQWPRRPSVHMLSTVVSHQMCHFTSPGAQLCRAHYRWPSLFLSVGRKAEEFESVTFSNSGAGSWNSHLIPSNFSPLEKSCIP